MHKLWIAAVLSLGLALPSTATGQQRARSGAASEGAQMCHLWYRDTRSGHIVDEPNSYPISRLAVLETSVKANNRRYPSRKYGVLCERVAVITTSLCQVVQYDPKSDGMIAGYGEALPVSQRKVLEANAALLNAKRRAHYRVECEHSGGE